MLGRHHVTLTVLTGATLLLPLFPYFPTYVFLAMFGVAIGSLVPDADSTGSAIFHDDLHGLQSKVGHAVNTVFSPLFPLFGYFTRYLIYFPAVFLLNARVFRNHQLRREHRGFLHSFLGVGTATFVTSAYIAGALYYFDVPLYRYVLVFGAAYLFGALMHLVQDSTTKGGVRFNQPFSKKRVYGRLQTGHEPKDVRPPNTFTAYFTLVATMMLLVTMLGWYPLPVLFAVSSGLVMGSWCFYAGFVARVRVAKR